MSRNAQKTMLETQEKANRELEKKRLSLTVSLGVAACIPQHGEGREELVQRCDKALYEAKDAGRNRVRAWPLEEDQPREPDGGTL